MGDGNMHWATAMSKLEGMAAGTTVSDLDRFAALMKDHDAQGTAEIWNIPISDQVVSPSMRRGKLKGHGVM